MQKRVGHHYHHGALGRIPCNKDLDVRAGYGRPWLICQSEGSRKTTRNLKMCPSGVLGDGFPGMLYACMYAHFQVMLYRGRGARGRETVGVPGPHKTAGCAADAAAGRGQPGRMHGPAGTQRSPQAGRTPSRRRAGGCGSRRRRLRLTGRAGTVQTCPRVQKHPVPRPNPGDSAPAPAVPGRVLTALLAAPGSKHGIL